MVSITGEQLQKSTGFIRAEARHAPVEVTYHGRPELVVLSIDDYNRLRENRKLSFNHDTMPRVFVEQLANAKMDAAHDHLNSLLDD